MFSRIKLLFSKKLKQAPATMQRYGGYPFELAPRVYNRGEDFFNPYSTIGYGCVQFNATALASLHNLLAYYGGRLFIGDKEITDQMIFDLMVRLENEQRYGKG